ncbi:hypothetical protein JAAARDRAFT_187313 [Jaapia argillacea MUCL 33604]|uniref:Uncharacterized protein n=1 Tax=Jaapia argillacea MUCL 33604 TaxID=933084 RepID=A0A067QA32_9AGAM|nr:hypothetical protein JAAARDRAFT_187313 [Jaapia argillacea MUCL 33604]
MTSSIVHSFSKAIENCAPIEKLPPELLIAIFTIAVSTAAKRRDFRRAIYISHISRRWREVAIHTPELWMNISLNVCSRKRFALGRLYLDRSLPHPVDVFISANRRVYPKASASVFAEVVDLLLRHFHRCHSLHITALDMNDLVEITNFGSSMVVTPLLEMLEVTFQGHILRSLPLPISFRGGTPSLRHIRLDHVLLHWQSPLLANLTTLEIGRIAPRHRPKYEELRDFFTKASSLRTLIVQSELLRYSSDPHIPVNSLRSLELAGIYNESTLELAPQIYTPYLVSLAISINPACPQEIDAWYLFANLVRDGPTRYPSLISLSLRDVPTDVLDTNFADAFPTVTQLNITTSDDLDLVALLFAESVGPLITDDPQACLWPVLQKFRIDGQVHAAALMLTTDRRTNLGYPLPHLYVQTILASSVTVSIIQEWLAERSWIRYGSIVEGDNP